MKRPTASPPRAGMIALTPTRASRAPHTDRQRTSASGYDAAMMFRQARLTQPSLMNWQRSANPSAVQPTSARCSKKTRMSWRTPLIAARTVPRRAGYYSDRIAAGLPAYDLRPVGRGRPVAAGAVLGHVRVAVILRRHEGLL